MTKKFKNFCLNAFYVAIILATIFSLYSKFYVIENLDVVPVIQAQPIDDTVGAIAEDTSSTFLIYLQGFLELIMAPFRFIANLFTSASAQVVPEIEEEVVQVGPTLVEDAVFLA